MSNGPDASSRNLKLEDDLQGIQGKDESRNTMRTSERAREWKIERAIDIAESSRGVMNGGEIWQVQYDQTTSPVNYAPAVPNHPFSTKKDAFYELVERRFSGIS